MLHPQLNKLDENEEDPSVNDKKSENTQNTVS